MKLELHKAINGTSNARLSIDEALSQKSEWFGLSLDIDFSNKRQRAFVELEKLTGHLPRSKRRKLRSEWRPSTATGRELWRKLASSSKEPLSNEFPFSLFTTEYVMDWIVGDRSDTDFRSRLVGILNNPKGLIESVLDLTNERHTIYALLRREGEEMQARMEATLQSAFESLSQVLDLNKTPNLTKDLRRALPVADFRRTIVSSFSDTAIDRYSDDELTNIVAACPSVSTFLNMYIAYACSIFDSNLQRIRHGKAGIAPRKPSDFGDMMHAVYAPYSDTFRCDAYFASLLRQDPNIKACIANREKLLELSATPTAA